MYDGKDGWHHIGSAVSGVIKSKMAKGNGNQSNKKDQKMQKYNIIVCYEGAINVDVEAENEDEATKKALKEIDAMPENEFLWALEPQVAETDVELVED